MFEGAVKLSRHIRALWRYGATSCQYMSELLELRA